MCGIVGITHNIESDEMEFDTSAQLIQALTYLQHRGQDSAGIATLEKDGKIAIHKDVGLVSQVFSEKIKNTGKTGIGHVRYSTQGVIDRDEAQPLYTNSPFGITLVHNGNLTNTEELRDYLRVKHRHVNTNSDSEILMNVLAAELFEDPQNIFQTIERVMKLLQGSYSVVAMIKGFGLVAFRDPRGIRPLCVGKMDENNGEKGHMFASESVAFIGSKYIFVRDLQPGECILINDQQKVSLKTIRDRCLRIPCLFEYIYFARPDSVMDGISVYEAREYMAILLAKMIYESSSKEEFSQIDVVIPVPETSRTYAIKLAENLNLRYREGFIKNRYIARTFIMSNKKNEQQRSKMVKMKLNTIDGEFRNKNVLIVDDSIVRGTTSKELVKLAKEAGAKRIWFASAAPPICFANQFGIDIPTNEELIAHNRNNMEIAEILGCDKVFYNDLEIVYKKLRYLSVPPSSTKPLVDGFEVSCFTDISTA